MARIGGTNSSSLFSRGNQASGVSPKDGSISSQGKVQPANSTFEAQLGTFLHQKQPYSLEELLQEYDTLSRRFLDSKGLEEFRNFRDLVYRILDSILEQGFQLKFINSTSPRTSQVQRHEVVVIRTKMAELSANFLQRNKEAMGLLKSVEEIRGLLINFLS